MVVRKAKKEDYCRIYVFLSNHYDCGNYYNWDIGRLCFTRFAENNEFNGRGYEAWLDDISIWEEDGEIVGIVHTEEPYDYFIQIAKEFKYLEAEMIEVIIKDVKRKTPNRASILLNADERDVDRIRLLESMGGKKLADVDTLRFLNVNDYVIESKDLKYKVTAIDKMNQELCEQISGIYRYVWPESRYVPNGEVVKRLLDNSDGFETLSWVVRKDDKIVAYTMGFVDANQEYVHLYPIALCQEYLDSEALAEMLDAITMELKEKGMSYAVICAWYKPEEDMKFRKHGYNKEHHVLFYEIPVR